MLFKDVLDPYWLFALEVKWFLAVDIVWLYG